jgi:archaellum component FlaC
MTDVESPSPASSPPTKEVRFNSKSNDSPGVQTVGSDGTMTIQHNFSNTSSSTRGAVMGMRKPAAAVLGVLFLGTFGAGLWGWLQIPGLNEQIKRLEEQVDRLEAQVDRLEVEVDRLGVQNDRYETLNAEFNQTISGLQEVNEDLAGQVGRLEGEVGRLGSEVDDLEGENDRYEQINGDLNLTVIELQGVNDDLRSTVASLDNSVNELDSTVADLELINQVLREENQRFSDLNGQLQTISSYLNETAADLNGTYQELAASLAEQITANRVLVLQTLQNSYTQLISFWDCSFRDVFRGQPFIVNEDLLIGGVLSTVLEYVEERVLSELCINTTDFTSYLDSRYGLNFLSSNQLYQGVAVYTSAAMDFYFPDGGEEGLTPEDWANAGYSCESVTKFTIVG